MNPRERLAKVLEALISKDYVSPGDVVVATGLPRYMVLAFIQCLEALGVIEPVYVKGSYKVYTATSLAAKLLNILRSNVKAPFETLIEQLVSSDVSGQVEAESA